MTLAGKEPPQARLVFQPLNGAASKSISLLSDLVGLILLVSNYIYIVFSKFAVAHGFWMANLDRRHERRPTLAAFAASLCGARALWVRW